MKKLNIDIYSDGADLEQMREIYKTEKVSGFTTNPSLMKKAGIKDYNKFVKEVVTEFPHTPISFEVFGDDFETMRKEALKLEKIADNVFVKIPITNSKGETSIPLINELANEGIKLNITAIFTIEQVKQVVEVLNEDVESVVSVFAGRIADTGIDPINIMKQSAEICHSKENVQLLWASPREVLNIIQAEQIGADIITCTPDLIEKTSNFDKDLEQYSLETVQMFLEDSKALGFSIL